MTAIPIFAQAPVAPPPKVPDAAYFSQDAKGVAKRCAEEADRAEHRNARVLAKCGEYWLEAGDRAKAQVFLDGALKEDAKDSRVHRAVARAWMRNGFRAEALVVYRAMATADHKWSFNNRKNVLTWVAVDLMQAGLVQEAAGYMEQAYTLDPKDSINCLDFGSAALMAEQRELAAAWFARALKADPKDSETLLGIASAHADYLLRARARAKDPSK